MFDHCVPANTKPTQRRVLEFLRQRGLWTQKAKISKESQQAKLEFPDKWEFK